MDDYDQELELVLKTLDGLLDCLQAARLELKVSQRMLRGYRKEKGVPPQQDE